VWIYRVQVLGFGFKGVGFRFGVYGLGFRVCRV
jgi:hypothetical protein